MFAGFDTEGLPTAVWPGGETEALTRIERHLERKVSTAPAVYKSKFIREYIHDSFNSFDSFTEIQQALFLSAFLINYIFSETAFGPKTFH